jgi:hypothetical protein
MERLASEFRLNLRTKSPFITTYISPRKNSGNPIYIITIKHLPIEKRASILTSIIYLLESTCFSVMKGDLVLKFNRNSLASRSIWTWIPYDKTSESDYFFFLHQKQNIFFSNIGNQNIFLEKNITLPPLQVKWSFPL